MRIVAAHPESAPPGQPGCPLCGEEIVNGLGAHLRQAHGEAEFRRVILAAKEGGMPDAQIGARYGVSFNSLEQIITEAYGANISVLKGPKRVKRWEPPHFREETTTVWSFKQRGGWATHDGRYRGNWSPYIPRNVITKYSRPGDVVLDYFVGGGTTGVEAKLLGRRCIARDINPGAVGITLENLSSSPPTDAFRHEALPMYEPAVSVGDARDLSNIPDSSVDLVCAHPPYAGIIKYGAKVEGDLSQLSIPDFLSEMGKVARESLRVLKAGGKCAILIGDTRKSKHVVPIGFMTMQVFLDAGFKLRELVIKRQHNCKTTGFWYRRSIEHNFLLLAHEYLPIFEKPKASGVAEQRMLWDYGASQPTITTKLESVERDNLETTTVWIFPPERLDAEVKRNLLGRFAEPGSQFMEITVLPQGPDQHPKGSTNSSLAYIKLPEDASDEATIASYRASVAGVAFELTKVLERGRSMIIDTKDFRIHGSLYPLAMRLWEDLSTNKHFAIKEIVIVVPETPRHSEPQSAGDSFLSIIHRYLLVFRRI